MSKIEIELQAKAIVVIKDAPSDDSDWEMLTENNGDVSITTPCGENVTIAPGNKGRFFKDMMKTYEKCAKAIGIWDTEAEEYKPKNDGECDNCFESPDECCCSEDY